MSKLALLRKVDENGFELVGFVDGYKSRESRHRERCRRSQHIFNKALTNRAKAETHRSVAMTALYSRNWTLYYHRVEKANRRERLFIKRMIQLREMTVDLSLELFNRGI